MKHANPCPAAAVGRLPLPMIRLALLQAVVSATASFPFPSLAFHPSNRLHSPSLHVPVPARVLLVPTNTEPNADAVAAHRYYHPSGCTSACYWRTGVGGGIRRQSQVGACLEGGSCDAANGGQELLHAVDPCVDIAARYLVPVLFQNEDGDDEDARSSAPRTIEAEKALKRCLRQCEKVWRGAAASPAAESTCRDGGKGHSAGEDSVAAAAAGLMMANLPSSSQTERQSSRKRLSDLILGTSVMRMRHWFVWNQRVGDTSAALDGNYLEPIVGVEPWMMKVDTDTSPQANENCPYARMGIARDLVQLHAQYLLQSDTAADDEAEYDVQWPTDTVQRIAVQQSLPSFIVRLLVDQYGAQDAEILCRLANKPGPITLRRNSIKCESDEALIRRLWEEDGIKSFVPSTSTGTDGDESSMMSPPRGCIRLDFDGGSSASERPTKSLWSLQAWKDGWFEVQDAGSQVIVDSVDIQQSDKIVVDFCAGNGGKSLALASKMWEVRQQAVEAGENSQAGTIIAHDIVESRLKQIQGSLTRAGLRGWEENDMRMVQNHIPTIRTTSNATSISEGIADAVLVDAPCSSLGVLRRRPGHRWVLTEDMITEDLPALQRDILTKAACLVKPGGKLVYATCSISRFENEDVVEMFESMDGFSNEWRPWIFEGMGANYRSISPHRDDSDGFFIARWRRIR